MTSPTNLRIVVAINPNASFGRSAQVGPTLVSTLRAAGHDVISLIEPDYEQLMTAARRALDEPTDALVVVGGDGMVHLGANLVAGTSTPLGIIPSGTGNDMARGLGIPVGDTEAAIHALQHALEAGPRTIDAARIRTADGEAWFACVASAGFDALVNERANAMRWPRGRQRYNLAIARELAKLHPIRYRITLDDEVIETEALLVAVANNVSFGGGMRITPDALLDDGLLDVLIVDPMSRRSFLRIFPRVFRGTHVTDPRVRILRSSSARVEADAVIAYADGERIAALPIDCVVVPGGLRMLAPHPAPRDRDPASEVIAEPVVQPATSPDCAGSVETHE